MLRASYIDIFISQLSIAGARGERWRIWLRALRWWII